MILQPKTEPVKLNLILPYFFFQVIFGLFLFKINISFRINTELRDYILLIAVLLVLTKLNGQDLTAKVLDADSGETLENVAVMNLKTGDIKFTGKDGDFTFTNIQFPLELQFSLIGYETEVRIFQQDQSLGKIFLQPEDVDQLSEIVLRSSMIPQQIRKTPASVGLISEKDLQRSDNFNLVQNFNYVPGVYVNQGALNTNKINIRGIGSRAQYSTNRIKAYINGIPLTTAEGELTLDDFDPEYLERIEIFKGPVSSVFGAGLGGAINLYTKKYSKDHRSVETEFSYGSFNTRKTNANITYVKDSLDIAVNYNNLLSDGYRENGSYDRIAMTANAGYLTKDGNYWAFLISHANLKAFIPSSLNEEDFKNNPQEAAFTWYESAGYESYSRNVLGLSYDHGFSENFRNQTSVFYNSRDGYEPRPFDILDDDRSSVGLRTRFNLKLPVFSLPSEVSFGAETMLEWYETGTFENLYEQAETRKSLQGDRLSLNHQNRNYLNLFAQLNMEITSKLLLEAGVNFNSTAYELEDRFTEDGTDQSGDYRFDPVFSPRLGLSYEAFPGKNIYASVSHGFSTPTVAETLTPEGLINTSLQTETGWNYELGFKANWLKKRLYTELNLYSIQIRNLLVARRVGQDQYVGVNAGKADHNGIEFLASYNTSFSRDFRLNLFLNSNYNFFVFDKFIDLGENYSGNEIPGNPEFMISPGLELIFKKLTTSINYQAYGKMTLNDANTIYTEPYQLLNLKFNYNWNLSREFDLSFDFGVNNMLDENYAASVVTNAVGFGGSAPRYYYPGNPRNYYGGFSLKYSL